MKAIILISSIFYLLGLKISNKIELVKRSTPVDKIVIKSIQSNSPEKSINLDEAKALSTETDTIQGGVSNDEVLQAK